MKTVQISDLLGKHMFSGAEFTNESAAIYKGDTDDAQVLLFVLDGKTYKAKEDPSDGYRSTLDSLEIVKTKVKNTFEPHQVVCIKKPAQYGGENATVQFIDIQTGQVVLEVGTDNNDDYYPSCVLYFNPEGLAANSKKKTQRHKKTIDKEDLQESLRDMIHIVEVFRAANGLSYDDEVKYHKAIETLHNSEK